MHLQRTLLRPHRFWLALAALILVALVASLPTVLSQQLIQPDGRINQVAHFGGDALYCVDENMNATNQYASSGGIRLLSASGQELWFVPALVIAPAVEQAKASGESVLISTGRGSYGPTSLYVYVTGDNDDYFVFNGYDEYGKANSLTFKFCEPTGPRVSTSSDSPPNIALCLLPVQKGGDPQDFLIDCNDCDDYPSLSCIPVEDIRPETTPDPESTPEP